VAIEATHSHGLRAALVTGLVALGLLASAPGASAEQLQVGVGRADITPPTGYYMMGWVRSDGLITGQNTRLWARVIVLKEGDRKIALVAEDLNGIPGGMMKAAADLDGDIGFSEQNVLDSASHTHAGPAGFYNFSTYNSVFMTINSPTDFQLTGGLDPQLYAFEVRQLALAIRRADANLGPGAAGWGQTRLTHLTQNRSLEAHLYDHGIHMAYGTATVDDDPKGYLHTIDPNVNVLRVDKEIGGRMVPVGMWSTFADHGTVNKYQFTYYNEDHHGSATRLTEAAIRRAGDVPRGQDVVNVYGNTDEGDQSAGLDRSGPAAADYVGRVEADHFLRAWRQAGRHLDSSPDLDWRWTRTCFCGQQTPEGPVADQGELGLAEFTGSEEGRGPLFDVTMVPFEGDHLPAGSGTQGDKIATPIPLDIPAAVPMMSVRVGDRVIVSVPGEMTEDMGRRVRAAVLQAATGEGVHRVVISGLANEYSSYFTTPEEYDAQHYEGAATVYGRTSSLLLEQVLVDLTQALVGGGPAPDAYPYDPRNGVEANAAPFPDGASDGAPVAQPAGAPRLGHPTFSWQGGPRGFDRPVEHAFVLVQRRDGGGWLQVDSDLGLRMLWRVDDNGVYTAEWEPPLDASTGAYRFRVTANHYALTSQPFHLRPVGLTARRVDAPPGQVAVVLAYPAAHATEDVGDPPPDAGADLTWRPGHADSGQARFLVNGDPVIATADSNGHFVVSAGPGDTVELAEGAGHDGFGNPNRNALTISP
jgi:neutral ceramidase